MATAQVRARKRETFFTRGEVREENCREEMEGWKMGDNGKRKSGEEEEERRRDRLEL